MVDSRRKHPRQFLLGDLVVVQRTVKRRGKENKLLPEFIGPFQIMKCLWPTTFIVGSVPFDRSSRIHRCFTVHISQLRPFLVPEDPITIPECENESVSSDVYPKELPKTFFGDPDHPVTVEPAVLREDGGGGSTEVDSPNTVGPPAMPEPVNGGEGNCGPIVDVCGRESGFPVAPRPRLPSPIRLTLERSRRDRPISRVVTCRSSA